MASKKYRRKKTRKFSPYHGAVDFFKKRTIAAALTNAKHNVTHAARALGLQRTYLHRLIKKYSLEKTHEAWRCGSGPERRTHAYREERNT